MPGRSDITKKLVPDNFIYLLIKFINTTYLNPIARKPEIPKPEIPKPEIPKPGARSPDPSWK